MSFSVVKKKYGLMVMIPIFIMRVIKISHNLLDDTGDLLRGLYHSSPLSVGYHDILVLVV